MKLRAFYHTAASLGVTLLIAIGGCSHPTPLAAVQADRRATTQPVRRVAIVLCGVYGDGPWYDGLINACKAAGDSAGTLSWGASKPFFFKNFRDHDVHDDAEAKLAAAIDRIAADIRIDLVGHSAGCGVILGALPRCHRQVSTVVLLAPSVSPWYQVDDALSHVRNKAYSYYSTRDTTFLKWRTSTFGGYDDIKAPAAGYRGFIATSEKFVQIAYDPKWDALGNDGGHNGWLAERFLLAEVSPRLRTDDDPR